jgi:hypothetical protein
MGVATEIPLFSSTWSMLGGMFSSAKVLEREGDCCDITLGSDADVLSFGTLGTHSFGVFDRHPFLKRIEGDADEAAGMEEKVALFTLDKTESFLGHEFLDSTFWHGNKKKKE